MARPHPQTSLLLERWHAGQRAALGELLEAHIDFVYRKVRERITPVLRARMQSGDCVQEALLEFLENAPRYQIANGRSFRGLLTVIAMNTMLEEERWWRAKRREITRERPMPIGSVLDLESPGRNPASIVGEREELHWNLLGLELLEPADRMVVVLRLYEDLDWAEIAEQVGKSSAAARMQFKRTLPKLARIVQRLRSGELDVVLQEKGVLDDYEERLDA